MKYTIIFFLLLTFLQLTVEGQALTDSSPVCTDKDAENFSSRGIKLGMRFEDVVNLFVADGKINTVNFKYSDGKGYEKIEGEYTIDRLNELAQSQAKNNYGAFFISGVVPKDSNRFKDILSYDFGFLDGKLSFIRIAYAKPEWTSVEQFIQTLAQTSNLPKVEYWSFGKIKCGSSEITAELTYRQKEEVNWKSPGNSMK